MGGLNRGEGKRVLHLRGWRAGVFFTFLDGVTERVYACIVRLLFHELMGLGASDT